MTKKEFEREVRTKLQKAVGTDADRLVAYYDELYADKIENGESETDIIAAFGPVDEIVANYVAEMELSPIEKFVKNKRTATRAWFRKHTAFLHNRTFWLVYFAGFIFTFPLTIGALGLTIGLFGAGIGVLTAIFTAWVAMYVMAFSLPLYGIWGLFSFLFDVPRTFAIGSVSVSICLASFGAGLLMIALTVFVQKQINKLFRSPIKKEVKNEIV